MRLEKDTIVIDDLQSAVSMKIYREKDFVTASLYEQGSMLDTRGVPQEVGLGSASSLTSFYLENNEIKTYSVRAPTYEDVSGYEDNTMIAQLYFLFPLQVREPLPVFFEKLMETIQVAKDEEVYNTLSDYALAPVDEKNYIGYLQYDADKTIDNGIRPRLENGETIVLESVFQGQVLFTKTISIKALKADQKSIMQEIMTEHLEAMNKLL